jgi:hypothetical protein
LFFPPNLKEQFNCYLRLLSKVCNSVFSFCKTVLKGNTRIFQPTNLYIGLWFERFSSNLYTIALFILCVLKHYCLEEKDLFYIHPEKAYLFVVWRTITFMWFIILIRWIWRCLPNNVLVFLPRRCRQYPDLWWLSATLYTDLSAKTLSSISILIFYILLFYYF